MNKKIQSKTEHFITFTDEELSELKIQKGDKFTVEEKDGAIVLTPFVSIELDLDNWEKDDLIFFFMYCNKHDLSPSDAINQVLENILDEEEDEVYY